MTLPVPIGITLETLRASRRITKIARGISFRSVVPGGYASAQVAFSQPLLLRPDELDFFADLTFTDTRHGGVLWQGRVEDLRRIAGSDGQIWDLSAVGPAAYARDRKVNLVYADKRVDVWVDSSRNTSSAENGTTTDLADNPVIRISVPEGSTITISWNGEMVYEMAYLAGQALARVVLDWDGGNNDADYLVRSITQTDRAGTPTVVGSVALTTTGGTLTDTIGADIPNGDNLAYLRLDSTANQTVSADTWIIAIPKIRTRLVDKSGADITTGYTSDNIYANAVVEDLLGRLLSGVYDGANATVEQAVYQMDQIAYSDGATPADILDDLMTLEPAFYWAVWEKQTNGKYRFEWRTYPTSVRYEATVRDGFDSPASASSLFNSVTVRWLGPNGQRQTTRVSSSVPELTTIGLTRTEFLDLGDDVASSANATQAGTEFLAEHAAPVNAAQLTVARPILDRDTGRYVSPWEILPGHLIRVRGTVPYKDMLNTARDGATIFRIVAVESSSDGIANLELDAFPPTVARAVSLWNRSWVQTRRRR